MRDLHAVHEDKEEIAEKERIAEIHARVAESQAQVKKWMEEFDEHQDSKRVKALKKKGSKAGGRGMIKKSGGAG